MKIWVIQTGNDAWPAGVVALDKRTWSWWWRIEVKNINYSSATICRNKVYRNCLIFSLVLLCIYFKLVFYSFPSLSSRACWWWLALQFHSWATEFCDRIMMGREEDWIPHRDSSWVQLPMGFEVIILLGREGAHFNFFFCRLKYGKKTLCYYWTGAAKKWTLVNIVTFFHLASVFLLMIGEFPISKPASHSRSWNWQILTFLPFLQLGCGYVI